MAPTPADNQPEQPQPTTTPSSGGISTASIVGIVVFGLFVIGIVGSIIAFYLHKRAERMKLPPEHRPVSYHPFRTESYKARLLDDAASPERDDKESMFSRDRGSSLSLYVDTDSHDHRRSMETVSLIPLHVTPAEEVHDPMENQNTSMGTGVSGTSMYSRNSRGSLTPISPLTAHGEEADLGVRKTRPRSTSSTSVRYYEVSPDAPAVPKIVHTVSD